MTHPAGTSAKWIFDVEIKKMEAEIFLHVEKIIIMLSERAKQKLIGL
jgi:hypothetical protein